MKKIFSLFLVFALVFTLFIGCTPKEDEDMGDAGDEIIDNGDVDDDTMDDGTTDDTDEPDTATAPSFVTDEASINTVMGSQGTWIVIFTEDMTTEEDLVLEGDFHDKNDNANDLYRKIAIYAQDADHNVTERYTLTAPKLTIKSPNAKLQGGTFKGDVYVEANGFTLTDSTVDGNVYFASEEYKDSFVTEKEGKVTGTTEVQ